MNDRVLKAVHVQSRAFYEGIASSAEAYAAIDRVAYHFSNYYTGVLNETRELFDRLVDSYISEDVDNRRQLNYEAQEMVKQLKRGPYSGEDFFRLQVSGNGQTRHINITPEQLRSLAMLLDQDAPPSAFEV
jgi:hypothetical protein